jgi:hypothetical protein
MCAGRKARGACALGAQVAAFRRPASRPRVLRLCPARPSSLLGPRRPARPRAVRALRATHHGPGARRRRPRPDRAGPRVPPRPHLRRDPARGTARHPGRGGQGLLRARGRRLQRDPAHRLEDPRALRGRNPARVEAGRPVPARLDPPAGRLHRDPAAGARVLPAAHDGARGRVHSHQPVVESAGVCMDDRRFGHQQARAQAGGGPAVPVARGRAGAPVRLAAQGQAGDPGPLRELHLPGERPLRLRRRLRVLLRPADRELHRGRCRKGRAARGHHQISPRLCSHRQPRSAPSDAATTSCASWCARVG